jgi:hypothetical protein
VSAHGYLEVGRETPCEIQACGDDGSNGINRRREVRMYITLYISASSAKGPSTRTCEATVSTVIATGNLRQGRLMADHGGLYGATKLRQIGAKEGQGGMRTRCFSYCKGKKRRGTVVGRVVCSLVALDSLVREPRPLRGCTLLIFPW